MLSSNARASDGSSTGVLPALHAVRWPAHRRGRIHRRNLTCHKPVEQVLNRGKALFDGRGRSLASQLLDVGGDVQRLHVGDRRDAGAFAPGQKFPNRLREARRVCRLRMLAAKNSRKRVWAWSPAVTTKAEISRAEEGRGAMWFMYQ
jgi:hypothetical protein